VATPAPPEEKPVTSLADALRASLAAVGDGDGDGADSRPGRPVSATEPKRATRRSA
jgi:hypothetical protein